MFIAQIPAKSASFGLGMFDSELEKPSGRDMTQNAWLTLTLKIKLNFVDSTNQLTNFTFVQAGKVFAKDYDGYLFPILNWDAGSTESFRKGILAAEKVWNWQFVLVTPRDYQGLDLTSMNGAGWLVRPNVLCLFRLHLVTSGQHRTINVVRLDRSVKSVKHSLPTKAEKKVSFATSPFRSDSYHYDDMDLLDKNTLVHEIGHALNQDHIAGLKGDASCKNGSATSGASKCYGTTAEEKSNYMGSGDRLHLINAISWRQRISEHTSTPPTAWQPTGVMAMPPRKVPLGVGLVSPVF